MRSEASGRASNGRSRKSISAEAAAVLVAVGVGAVELSAARRAQAARAGLAELFDDRAEIRNHSFSGSGLIHQLQNGARYCGRTRFMLEKLGDDFAGSSVPIDVAAGP